MSAAYPEKFRLRMRRHAEKLELAKLGAAPGANLERYRNYLRLGDSIIRRYHRLGASGLRVARARAVLMDELLFQLFTLACSHWERESGRAAGEVSLLALGGYGRLELCPHSDVDIMFLYPTKTKDPDRPRMQRAINDAMLYMLWDLGLKVGHSTRTVREALEEGERDVHSKNAMIESRLICGSTDVEARFRKEYDRYIRKDNARIYIEQRLHDQRLRREKFGGTVFLQEPDIKNGVGGLRDYQNILWMARLKLDSRDIDALIDEKLLRKNEHQAFKCAYDFLLRVRNELHFQSNRPTDVLNLEKQPQIAWSLGYHDSDIFPRVEKFMRDYYRAAQTIFRTSNYLEQRLALDNSTGLSFQTVIESRRYRSSRSIDGFAVINNRLSAESDSVFRDDPVRLIRLFRHRQQLKAKLDLDLTRLVTESLDLIDDKLIAHPDANRCLRSILQEAGDVHSTVEAMNATGVLSRFIPEWEALHCLVQHEYYHRYTADEHTLNTIRELDGIFAGENEAVTRKYRKALEKTNLPALLYLILLLHDIGKGQGISGHAETGAEIAETILARMGVMPKLRSRIQFLIRNHLEMARFWQHFDVDDPRTIRKFAELVGDAETLRYLYVLTYCDARGTMRDLWNSYKDTLHTQLFKATLHELGELDAEEEQQMIPKEVIIEEVSELSRDEVDAHYNLLPERYFIYNDAAEIALHLRMVHKLLRNISEADSIGSLVPVVEWRDDLSLGLSVVHVVTWDRAGLFYKLAGAFSLAGLSIVSSRALTRADHITIDTFYVCDPNGGIVQNSNARETFHKHIEDALLHNRDLTPRINAAAEKSRKPSYANRNSQLRAPLPSSVDVYHELSLRRTIIEIQATDSIGLLYRLAKAIYDHGFDITFARIATERNVAVDTFYIEPIDNITQSETGNLLALREALNTIVTRSERDS